MAENDRDDALDKLSLDRPKLFGRRRSKAASQPEPAARPAAEPLAQPVAESVAEPVAEPEPRPERESVAEPVSRRGRAPEPVAEPAPAVDDTRRFAPPEANPGPASEPTPEPPAREASPAAVEGPRPGPHAAPATPPAEPEPTPTPAQRTEEPAVPAASGPKKRSAGTRPSLGSVAGGLRQKLANRTSSETTEDGVGPRQRWTPPVAGVQAVAIVGLLAGVLVYGLSLGTLKACEVVRGTSSCGGAGYLYLMAILVAAALVGGWALDRCSIPDPRATAMLAVGIIAVVVLLILVPVLFSWTMVLVIPLVSTLAFLGSHAIAGVDLDKDQRWQPEDDDPAASSAPVVSSPVQADRHDAGLGGRP